MNQVQIGENREHEQRRCVKKAYESEVEKPNGPFAHQLRINLVHVFPYLRYTRPGPIV
jgi:hypothetical protein